MCRQIQVKHIPFETITRTSTNLHGINSG